MVQVADVAHREQERALLLRRGGDASDQQKRIDAADQAAQALWLFLDGIVEACSTDEVGPRLPRRERDRFTTFRQRGLLLGERFFFLEADATQGAGGRARR